MKTDKTYKMDKQTKIMLSNIEDMNHRAVFKKLFVEAENLYVNNKRKMSVKHVSTTDTED